MSLDGSMTPWTGGEPGDGETFVWGRDSKTARALLDAAARVGIDPQTVRTTRDGYIVPDAVWDAMQDTNETGL
jgi:hypothetical protein